MSALCFITYFLCAVRMLVQVEAKLGKRQLAYSVLEFSCYFINGHDANSVWRRSWQRNVAGREWLNQSRERLRWDRVSVRTVLGEMNVWMVGLITPCHSHRTTLVFSHSIHVTMTCSSPTIPLGGTYSSCFLHVSLCHWVINSEVVVYWFVISNFYFYELVRDICEVSWFT